MLLALVVALAVITVFFGSALSRTAKGEPFYLKVGDNQTSATVADQLEEKGVARSAFALKLYLLARRINRMTPGTYQFHPGMSAAEIAIACRHPIIVSLYLPENFWIARKAKMLQAQEVVSAEDFIAATQDTETYQPFVEFKLPSGSLEGYLYPDRYNFAPKSAPQEVIAKQLAAFNKKVWLPLGKPGNLRQAVIVASMVELETMRDSERPKVARVIYNRIAKGMPLQIDATVNYALQEWRPLKQSEYHSVKSPFNTYLHTGLPPGPICSPGLRSIQAALKPAEGDYLYYVAMPDGHQVFTSDYQQHLKNVALRRKLMAQKQNP
ncbi:MAG: endolytic transglycosylase MltG [Armatimonadetes bacterium]|nr:endolytic transglycosylase MltG [Armatimonadota bacterium]